MRWMSANSLSMNDSNTQYLPIVPKSIACLVDRVKIRVGEDIVTAATSVRNLGVYFDRHLDMNSHVSHVISACSFHLRNINHISRYLPKAAQERVVNAIITSRITIVIHYSTTAR